ncbi:Ig-like domain-containing protein [Salinisphaera sp.]|uniref:Ig-like domain-containing protein n=1 Tax=Salinisphaera sp. TaxID=1914330 RepID=UPI002D7967FF|nr:Ig-like domain-containing protein [Salinisphaera sp.]HET7312936.1 Ig-like domain-containing protein [Salinisphaera sp.]
MQKKRLTGAPGAAQGGMFRPKAIGGFARSGVHWGRGVGVSLVLAAIATSMTACSSGSGGDNGVPDQPQASGSVFAYPYNGQQDVTLNSQIVVKFEHGLSSDANKALALRAGSATADNAAATVSADSDSSDAQAGILTITPAGDLKPNTTYYIVATQNIADSAYGKGDTITQFTTGPAPGRPADTDRLQVVETTPGNVNPVTHDRSVFTQFNSVHVVFSEPVDASTVVAGNTFKFTNANGDEIPGRLTVIGHELTFDPAKDLAPGKYKLSLTDGVISEFGKALDAYSETKTVLDAGRMAVENTIVTPSADDVDALPDNALDGGPINLVSISNQLIGQNKLPAMNSPARQGVQTVLAQPGMDGFGDVLPATIRAGQKFQLTPLSLRLNGDVPTPIKSGPIQVQFASDANVYLMANDLSNVTVPTAVRLRFDLAISTLIESGTDQATTLIQSLADGVFNQSVLNIQAAGLAIPQDNGDLKIDTLGTFSILVNRTDHATVDFELSLTLPGGDQTPVQKDKTAPYLVAQSPSACLYTFGTPAYNPAYSQYGAAPTALPEKACLQTLAQGNALDTQSGINNFPIEANPAIVFSEPVDPATINDNSIQLSYTAGGASGSTPVTFSVDGSSVIIDPTELLEPNARYTITLGNGESIKDVAGNALVDSPTGIGPTRTIGFTTEPLVDNNPAPPILGELTPGVPCALTGGDFNSGGDTAGQCVGDAGNGTTNPLAVFTSPANVPVTATFSKFVAKDSIVLADGCLSGGGDANEVAGATVALERVDGSGQCMGTPAAAIAFANRDGDTTRGFSIRPVHNLTVGDRYQIVICGTDNSACSSTIVDTEGRALNTDPLNGSGSTDISDPDTVAGGPDIRMPFDVVEASQNYYTDQFTLPATDTNGNGRFDDANGDGAYTPGDADERPQPGNRSLVQLTSSFLGNSLAIDNPNRSDGRYPAYLSLTRPIAIGKTLDDCSAVSNVVSDSGDSVVGAAPSQCIRVALLPGGQTGLTSIKISSQTLVNSLSGPLNSTLSGAVTPIVDALSQAAAQSPLGQNTPLGQVPGISDILGGLAGLPNIPGLTDTIGSLLNPADPNNTIGTALNGLNNLPGATQVLGGLLSSAGIDPASAYPLQTGRVLLRFPNMEDDNGGDAGNQSGYIVPECQGSLNGTSYDFSPCFVASLRLIANAPDGQGLALDQQELKVNVVGPVTFEQNGRLVISLRNANTFALNATALGLLPAQATVGPGGLTYQLVGNAVHGGRAYPER